VKGRCGGEKLSLGKGERMEGSVMEGTEWGGKELTPGMMKVKCSRGLEKKDLTGGRKK